MDLCNLFQETESSSAHVYTQSSEYHRTVQLCWSLNHYHDQKKLMKRFLALQDFGCKGSIPRYTTIEDMSEWLVLQSSKIPDRIRMATSEEGGNLAFLTWQVNTNLMMRDMELEAARELTFDLGLTIENMATSDLSYLSPEVNIEVLRALRSVSRTLTFEPCSRLCCPAQVLADLVPRLLLTLRPPQAEGLVDRPSMVLSGLAVTIVLRVLENLSAGWKDLPPRVHYSRPVGIHAVRSVLRRIRRLCHPQDLSQVVDAWSLVGAISTAVTVQLRRLFEDPPELILVPSVLRAVMGVEPRAAVAHAPPPHTPADLVLHLDTLRNVLGVTVNQVYDGAVEEGVIDLSNWPLLDDVRNRLWLGGLKVSRKREKVTWHPGAEDLLRMATLVHNDLHHLCGTKQVMKVAASARARVVTRHLADHVAQRILLLRDSLCEGREEEEEEEHVDKGEGKEEEEEDKKEDEVAGDTSELILKHILVLFLQKVHCAASQQTMAGPPVLKCLSLAGEISALIHGMVARVQNCDVLTQKLEQLTGCGSNAADRLYRDYEKSFSPSQSLGLQAFSADTDHCPLVAAMVANFLLFHALPPAAPCCRPPGLSRSATYFELSPSSESWGRARNESKEERKSPSNEDFSQTNSGFDDGLADVVTTATAGDLQAVEATLNLKPKGAVTKHKKNGVGRFFRRVLRFFCCCKSVDEQD